MTPDRRPPAPIHVRRQQQLRDAGLGCLLALVFEGAAILAGVLWGISRLLGFERLAMSAAVAFFAFTVAALGAGLLLLILGNTRAQRRLRREAMEQDSLANDELAE